jgi:hypothetical protein
VDGGQPTYLTNLRKKEKPSGPAGKEQIGSKAPIAGRDGPGPGCGGEGREWRTGERECVNQGTGASAERTRGRERERESVCACGASDALLLCCAFVAVLFSGLQSLSAFVLRRNFFARVVCTLSLERSSVCFIFRVVWFGLVCRVFFWLVSQPAVIQTCFCCLLLVAGSLYSSGCLVGSEAQRTGKKNLLEKL